MPQETRIEQIAVSTKQAAPSWIAPKMSCRAQSHRGGALAARQKPRHGQEARRGDCRAARLHAGRRCRWSFVANQDTDQRSRRARRNFMDRMAVPSTGSRHGRRRYRFLFAGAIDPEIDFRRAPRVESGALRMPQGDRTAAAMASARAASRRLAKFGVIAPIFTRRRVEKMLADLPRIAHAAVEGIRGRGTDNNDPFARGKGIVV